MARPWRREPRNFVAEGCTYSSPPEVVHRRKDESDILVGSARAGSKERERACFDGRGNHDCTTRVSGISASHPLSFSGLRAEYLNRQSRLS